MKKSKTNQTPSVWDNIANILTKFITKHWWKVGLLFLMAGIALSGFSFKTKNTEFKKDAIELPQIKG